MAQTVVEMERGFLFLMSVSDGSSLAVLAHPGCDIGLVRLRDGAPASTARVRSSHPTCAPNYKAVCSTDRPRHHPCYQITVRPPQSPHGLVRRLD